MVSWQPRSGSASDLWGAPASVIERTWTSVRQLQEDASLHQVIDVAAHVARRHDLTRLAKRCLVSASYVVLKTPPIVYRQVGGDDYLAGFQSGWDMPPEQRQLEETLVSEGFHEIPFCVVLPETIRVSCEASGGDDLDVGLVHAESLNEELQELENHIYSLPVGADYAMVRRLLKQDGGAELKTGVLMPEVSNLSLSDLTQLRQDYDGSFARLRYSLKQFLDGIAGLDSERRFTELIEKIDHECRLSEDDFKRIQRKHSRSLKGMLVTSSLVGVAAASELAVPGLFAAATAALGSVTLNSVIANRVATTDRLDDLGKSDHWIAWKIHQENQLRAKSR